ncbi:hypothetical protein ACVWW4_004705 [Bradyrhizobium sp. LB7.1]
MVEHVASDADDRDADHNSKLMQDLLLAQKRHRSAYGFQHLNLEQRFSGQGGRRTGGRHAGAQRIFAAGSGIAQAPFLSPSAFSGGVEFGNSNKNSCFQYFRQGYGLLVHGLALSAVRLTRISMAILRSRHEVLMISTAQCSVTA